MNLDEPTLTALFLVACGVLMGVAVLFSRASDRLGVPLALLFLAVGMAAGTDGIGGIQFDDYRLAFRLGTVALVLILFDGGLNTPRASVLEVLKPASVLATLGVVGTAGAMAVAARLAGLEWGAAMLLGAIVSSTDAAATFAVLRGSGLALQRRVGLTLELESGANDPMAVILTLSLTGALVSGEGLSWDILWQVPLQLAVGLGLGLAIGMAGRRLVDRVRLTASGMLPVLTASLAFLAFGVPTLFYGSGFLAVYVAAMVLGNSALPYRAGVLRVHDALAWFSQVAMFLMLGLLVYPTRLLEVAPGGLLLGLALAFVARPLVVFVCLLPFRFPAKEVLYIAWVGLRGAVPIILATFPVLAGAPQAERIFDLVFFIVVVSALVPGSTVRAATKRLGLEAPQPPAPAAVLEIASMRPLRGEVLGFHVDRASPVRDAAISDIPFPPDSAAMLIVRGESLLAPRGPTIILEGDHVFVFCRPEDKGLLQLMFGRSEAG